jgi:hypothetical protein
VGEIDIWVSDWIEDSWSTPYNAGLGVNTTGSECLRWISDDDQEFVISSTGPGGYGSADIYFTRMAGDSLGQKINFGPVINTGDTEMGSSFLENSGGIGGIMFFGSSRPGGQGNRDIWYSSDGSSLECRTWAEIKSAF